MNQLMERIRKYDFICFDLFDTLLTRQIYDAEAVFDMVGERAMRKGIAVEGYREKRKMALFTNTMRNPTIYEIYDRFQEMTQITDRQRDFLLHLELQTEKDVLVPRKTVVDVLNYAVAEGKCVFIVTDMYLPASILGDILSEKGIFGYQKLYVSCDFRQLKYEGLFGRVLQDTVSKSILHIGDHVEYDGYWSMRYGIDFYQVQDCAAMLRRSTWFFIESKVQNLSLNDKLILGKVCAEVFHDPFTALAGMVRPLLKTAYQVGYCLYAPIVTHFMMWMNEKLKETDADEILFGARDGYLFQKLYRIMKERRVAEKSLPDTYFLTSRVACFSACADKEENILESISGITDEDPVRILTDIFQIPKEQLPVYQKGKYKNWVQFVLEQQPLLRTYSKTMKKNYIRYMEKMGISQTKKYLFFDLVSQGTCQHYLSQFFGLNMDGIYFWKRVIPTSKIFSEKKAGCYESGISEDDARFVTANYLYLEAVLTDPEIPSVRCFAENGEPIFASECRTADEIQFIREVQQGIVDYFTEFLDKLWIPQIDMEKDLADIILSFLDDARTCIQNPVWENLHVIDDLKSGRRVPVNV